MIGSFGKGTLLKNASAAIAGNSKVPLQSIHFKVDIFGGRATVSIDQVYENKGNNVLDVDYTFPVLSRSCLLSFRAISDDNKYYEGVVLEKNKAFAESADLTKKGLTHGLATNFKDSDDLVYVFIGNLKPKSRLRIELVFTIALDVLSYTAFRFRLPIVFLHKLDSLNPSELKDEVPEEEKSNCVDSSAMSLNHNIDVSYTYSFELTVDQQSNQDVILTDLRPFDKDEVEVKEDKINQTKKFCLKSTKNIPNQDIMFSFRRSADSQQIASVFFESLKSVVFAQVVNIPDAAVLQRCAYCPLVIRSIGKVVLLRQ